MKIIVFKKCTKSKTIQLRCGDISSLDDFLHENCIGREKDPFSLPFYAQTEVYACAGKMLYSYIIYKHIQIQARFSNLLHTYYIFTFVAQLPPEEVVFFPVSIQPLPPINQSIHSFNSKQFNSFCKHFLSLLSLFLFDTHTHKTYY